MLPLAHGFADVLSSLFGVFPPFFTELRNIARVQQRMFRMT